MLVICSLEHIRYTVWLKIQLFFYWYTERRQMCFLFPSMEDYPFLLLQGTDAGQSISVVTGVSLSEPVKVRVRICAVTFMNLRVIIAV